MTEKRKTTAKKKRTAPKKLVIVESPTKVDSVKKYLGSSYNIEATMGHLRDLPKSQLGVDTENNFEPKYITIRGKGELIAKLKKKAKAADKVYLATDPDREGEAISWHLAHILNIDPQSPCRITFNEVTKDAVKESVKEARGIDMDLVDAQQTRRILDRIVGYQISPLLWKKVKKGLSAGRVQSAVTRMIVDREREIDAFTPQEYWSIDVKLGNEKKKLPFMAKFYGTSDGKKLPLETEKDTMEIVKELERAEFCVSKITKKETKRRSAPPFTTSTMQQEASRKLNFTTRRTMMAAQQLYEMGFITYMRTDSLRISESAQNEARAYIAEKYGTEYVPKTPKQYKAKKSAQDAHEAIRPTFAANSPEKYKDTFKPDQFKLYRLIWLRFMASQMSDAILDTVSADIKADKYLFKASGSTVKFVGFTMLYVESKDTEEEKAKKLPALSEGQALSLLELIPAQHFTQPPPRYTEASLVKAMEEEGIGRPSTYAPTIATITARGYVARDKKTLYPTELGYIVTDLMKENFKDIVDLKFTANMEDKIEDVANGSMNWREVVRDFYDPFEKTLKDAEERIGDIEIKDEVSDVICEKCGRNMVYKQGKFGKFLACPGFPECRNTKPITVELGVPCPKCGGKVLVKKSKKGATFYACENSPGCDFISWDEPTEQKCPKCGSILMKKHAFRRNGPVSYVCYNEDCDYTEKAAKKSKTEKED
ncbi:MAG TPA: type I DNA topoisomerase [Candidatus Monoglobus merdigallinarum]|uniref:DNA topoisomerase 1 n=1 Tax=Candidatus Monoglobus merdigallinarum TaxID=2838698 RepID=A0A9D1PRG0_9FIRM|nr:type I DNA topoisomerase [Candidatus Monoglobus merdigallinarum]